MNTSSLSDSVVLRETQFSEPDAKGRVQLKFMLPSKRVVTSSDWLVPAEIKGKVLIAWADAIRAEDAFDIQEREERERLARVEKRAQQLSSGVPTASGAPAQSATSNAQGTTSSAQSASSGPGPVGTSKSSSSSSLPDDPTVMVREKLATLTSTRDELDNQLAALTHSRKEVVENICRWRSIADSLGIALEASLPSPPKTLPDGTSSKKPSGKTPATRRRNRKRQQAAANKKGAEPDLRQDAPVGETENVV